MYPFEVVFGRYHQIRFYLEGELVMTARTETLLPVEGTFITYRPLEGPEVRHRVGEVHIVLEEGTTRDYPGGPVTYIEPVVEVELQP